MRLFSLELLLAVRSRPIRWAYECDLAVRTYKYVLVPVAWCGYRNLLDFVRTYFFGLWSEVIVLT